jgi:hypothetical protein
MGLRRPCFKHRRRPRRAAGAPARRRAAAAQQSSLPAAARLARGASDERARSSSWRSRSRSRSLLSWSLLSWRSQSRVGFRSVRDEFPASHGSACRDSSLASSVRVRCRSLARSLARTAARRPACPGHSQHSHGAAPARSVRMHRSLGSICRRPTRERWLGPGGVQHRRVAGLAVANQGHEGSSGGVRERERLY